MAIDTDAEEKDNAAITDPADENIEEDEQQEEDLESTDADQEENVDEEEQEETEEKEDEKRPTRSETRKQNYIDKLSQDIRSSGRLSNRPDDEHSTSKNGYQPLQYKDGDYSPEELEADRRAYGESLIAASQKEFRTQLAPIEQKAWARDLKDDNREVLRDWPVLDETSKDFDPDSASDLNKLYLEFIGFNANEKTGDISIDRPGAKITDFMRAEKQIIDRFVERALETSTKNIASQAAKTGIRPGAQSRAPKGANMSYEDLMKLPADEYDKWGRAAADKILNERLGIK